MENFGRRLRMTRKSHGISQARFARSLEIGSDQVGEIERDEVRCPPDRQLYLVEVLQQLVIWRKTWCVPRKRSEMDLKSPPHYLKYAYEKRRHADA